MPAAPAICCGQAGHGPQGVTLAALWFVLRLRLQFVRQFLAHACCADARPKVVEALAGAALRLRLETSDEVAKMLLVASRAVDACTPAVGQRLCVPPFTLGLRPGRGCARTCTVL